MKGKNEGIWKEYFMDECAVMETDEERRLAKTAADLHERAVALLNGEQEEAVSKYIEALYGVEAAFAEKAFLKGCRFAFSFLMEAGILGK